MVCEHGVTVIQAQATTMVILYTLDESKLVDDDSGAFPCIRLIQDSDI